MRHLISTLDSAHVLTTFGRLPEELLRKPDSESAGPFSRHTPPRPGLRGPGRGGVDHYQLQSMPST